jgi:hypothetical protein
MRKVEREAAYKRIKQIVSKDSDITDKQLHERFGIDYRKIAKLRLEVED